MDNPPFSTWLYAVIIDSRRYTRLIGSAPCGGFVGGGLTLSDAQLAAYHVFGLAADMSARS